MTNRTTQKLCPMNLRPQTLARCGGFTLVELVIVIVLTGIVAAMTAVFITRPISGYVDLTRRARLVDATENALRRMARDIRIALPNSVRVTDSGTGASFALEVLPTLFGGRYITGTGTAACDLDLSGADTDFTINGLFQGLTLPRSGTADRLVINNLGTGGQDDVYSATTASPSVVSPKDGLTTITFTLSAVVACAGFHRITLNPGYQFKSASPRARVFVVQTPVTYLCDTAAGTLTRYADYAIQAAQPTTAATLNALPGVTSGIVTDRVVACSVTTTTSVVQQRGIVTLSLTLAEQGEQVRLIQQVQLDNSR